VDVAVAMAVAVAVVVAWTVSKAWHAVGIGVELTVSLLLQW